jgi:hypothetical protein
VAIAIDSRRRIDTQASERNIVDTLNQMTLVGG